MKKRRYLLIAALPLAFVLSLVFLSGDTSAPPIAAAGPNTIPGRYIVVMKHGVSASGLAAALNQHTGVHPDVVYTAALNGFAADMSQTEAENLARSPAVESITPDQTMSIDLHTNNFQTLTTGPDRIDLEQNATANVTGQPNGTALNVDVAVIDTGVITTHPEINVAGGKGLWDTSQPNCGGSSSYEDDHGHGSHVAGTIAARDNDRGLVGIAPGARIWAVKVLAANGSGSNACVIAGIDWVTNRRQEFNDGAGDGDPGIDIKVINMSLGGDTTDTPALDPLCQAINSANAAGIIVAVAAGNSHHDVDGGIDSVTNMPYLPSSPAHCLNAITVSAFGDFDGKPGGLGGSATFSSCPAGNQTILDDSFACFSNYGAAVDIAAPGVNIISTYLTGGCGAGVPCYATMSGTSMATPHVAGALALFTLATGYNGSAAGPVVMAAFTSAGYTRAQNSPCGFTGDPDGFPEPVLYVGNSCTNVALPTPTPVPTPVPTPTPTPSATPSPSPTPTPTPSPEPTIQHATPTQPPKRLQGDVNCDNAVTGQDSLQILLALGNLPSSACAGAPDTNCNGHTDLGDALLILRYLSGRAVTVPDCTTVGQQV